MHKPPFNNRKPGDRCVAGVAPPFSDGRSLKTYRSFGAVRDELTDKPLTHEQAGIIITLASAFNQAGGMFVDTPEAIACHEALADACDAAPNHDEACDIARGIVEAFDY